MYINILVLQGNTCFVWNKWFNYKGICTGDGFFFYKNDIHVKGTDRSIQQSKMVSNFLQMDVKVYRLSRFPLIIPFEGYKTMACV